MSVHVQSERPMVWIDNHGPMPGDFVIEQQSEVLETLSPKADPRWTRVDTNGHVHACTTEQRGDGRYPTLLTKARHVDCAMEGEHDDECDGHDVLEYHCRVCDEVIEPGTIPGPHRFAGPTRTSWRVEVVAPSAMQARRPGQLCTVAIKTQDQSWIGVGVITDVTSRPFDDYVTVAVGDAGPIVPVGVDLAKALEQVTA